MMNFSSAVQKHLSSYDVVEEESPLVTNPDIIFSVFGTGRRHDIPDEKFLSWVEEADYENTSASWWSQFSSMYLRKMLEHYASIELVGIKSGGVYLDLAASASPFYKVIRRTHDAKMCYAQDLNRAPGVREDIIGSNAADIPLPDACLDGIVSHNSWEHFEGSSAFDSIIESVRLLKPGGKLCIIPLNFRERTEIWTSPSCWATKYVNAKDLPDFDPAAAIVIRDEIIQRQVMWWRASDLTDRLSAIPGVKFEVIQVVCMGLSNFALVGTKVAPTEQ